MLPRGLHGYLMRYFMASRYVYLVAHGLFDGFQDVDAMGFGYLMAFGYGGVLGGFDGYLPADFVGHNMTADAIASIMSIGLGVGLSLCFGLATPTTIVMAITSVSVMGIVAIMMGVGWNGVFFTNLKFSIFKV